MTLVLGRLPGLLARAAVIAAVAGGLGACSIIPGWMGGDAGETSSGEQMDQTADNGQQAPDLAGIPDKPAVPSTPDDQKQVADSLKQDQAHNQYSGDALRGGTEAAAPPPGAPPPPSADDVASTAPPSHQASTTPAPAAAPQPAEQTASTAPDTGDNGAIDATGGPGTGDTSAAPAARPTRTVAATPMPSSSGGPAVPAVSGTSSSATPATQVAMADAPVATPMPAPMSGSLPAVPMNAPMMPTALSSSGPVTGAQGQVSDADLGFQPSKAPPLDPSVSQFVPAPIIARYRQTSGAGSVAMPSSGAAMATPGKAMGGPERMSGAVVANFDALQGGSVAPTASVYSNTAGLPPTSVVFFPHDTTVLNGSGKAQVRAAVQAFQAAGGQGYIRVVGHSSSRTASMSLQRHLIFNFERSQARANAVARELIALGVPANKVLVEAVGDAQPVYYESMPQGEEGNRRAEIFVQS
ncbi:MAG TPA: OmpA family protein [Rhizomicrobium sp.]|jgi:outer membrane protein OmpA-like peptidoglycan-associated protein|nr:OmpA family protein [Rhizomicrobium sp.]